MIREIVNQPADLCVNFLLIVRYDAQEYEIIESLVTPCSVTESDLYVLGVAPQLE